MTAAIWSTPPDKCTMDFPAQTLVRTSVLSSLMISFSPQSRVDPISAQSSSLASYRKTFLAHNSRREVRLIFYVVFNQLRNTTLQQSLCWKHFVVTSKRSPPPLYTCEIVIHVVGSHRLSSLRSIDYNRRTNNDVWSCHSGLSLGHSSCHFEGRKWCDEERANDFESFSMEQKRSRASLRCSTDATKPTGLVMLELSHVISGKHTRQT